MLQKEWHMLSHDRYIPITSLRFRRLNKTEDAPFLVLQTLHILLHCHCDARHPRGRQVLKPDMPLLQCESFPNT